MDAWVVGNGAAAGTADAARVADAERDLVARHAAGDGSAFDELYARFSGMVYQLALRMSGGREEALDVAQEVFLRIHRHLAGFRGGSTLKTWIYRITVNQCRSAGSRHRPAAVSIDDDDQGPTVVDPSAGPEDLASRAEFFGRVERALTTLAPEYREALVLRDIEELSYEEISAVMGVPLGTVRSRIARGRERLRIQLEARP
jgi:RNA polymerase sigma-70 factor (ECF subfamily)